MAYAKLIQFAQLLWEKTKRGEIRWETAPQNDVFQTSLSNYAILIGRNDSNDLSLQLYNQQGNLIEELPEYDAGNSGFPHLDELYHHARRIALGVEKALDDILKELGSSAAKA